MHEIRREQCTKFEENNVRNLKKSVHGIWREHRTKFEENSARNTIYIEKVVQNNCTKFDFKLKKWQSKEQRLTAKIVNTGKDAKWFFTYRTNSYYEQTKFLFYELILQRTIKELSLCHKLWFSSHCIFGTKCCRPYIFQNMNSVRSNNLSLKYQRFTTSCSKDIEV